MKKICLMIFMALAVHSVVAQVEKLEGMSIPALKRKLDSVKDDKDKIIVELALGREILLKPGAGKLEIDSALNLSHHARKLSIELKYHEGNVNALLLYALSYNKKKEGETGLKFAKQALALSQKVGYPIGIAESFIIIGQHFPITDSKALQTRIDYYQKAIEIFRKEQNMRRLASTLEAQAELSFLAHRRTEAIKLLFEALSANKALNNLRVQGIYWLIGRTSINMGDYPNAMKYHLLAIKTAEQVKDTTLMMCSIYHTMAGVHTSMSDHKGAIPYSLKALQIARKYNEGEYIIVTATLLANEYTRTNNFAKVMPLLGGLKKYADNDDKKLFVSSSTLYNLTLAGKFQIAESYAQEVADLLNKMPAENHMRFLYAFHYLANYYAGNKQYERATHYANEYTKLANRSGVPSSIKEIEKLHYKLDSTRGDFKSAMVHYQNAQRIKDSTDNVTKAYQISMLNIENETEKKNNDIDSLNKQAVLKDSVLKRNETIQKLIIAGFIILLMITGLIYSRYQLKRRSNALLLKQKSEIDAQNNVLQQLVNEKNELIVDKDHLLMEKELLLKEVNHRVKNNLQIIMSLLQSQSGYLQNENAQKAILESQNRVQAIALIHNQLFQTDKVSEIDLESYVSELVQSLDYSINSSNDRVKISFQVARLTLDVSQAVPVGIILNEAVTNALKYAFPNELRGTITVLVKKSDSHVEMSVSDNGIGLPTGFGYAKAESLGINLIEGLAAQLKGTSIIENLNGVTIKVRFPIELPAAARHS